MTVLGAVILLGGVVSLLAGVMERRRRRRLLAGEHTAWASIAAAPTHPEYEPSAYRPLLRFDTDEGRPVEVFSPVAPTARRPLVEGRKILVHYDPDDPVQIVVHGEHGRGAFVFIALGLAAIAGAVVAFVFA
ncbi:DUF3592 domain-containing protein [Catenulispora subtropica]|uniref:DUF3592 domain-containing protein n=1 Tax=Catenulispora subtropica TaxID=450798 RepID=A0ABP5C8X8_9ACTN